jgi:hypothetical protein
LTAKLNDYLNSQFKLVCLSTRKEFCMDIATVSSELSRAGILRSALTDGLTRAQAAYEQDPSLDLASWISRLQKDARHLFGQPPPETDEAEMPWESLGIEQAQWESWSPEHRLGLYRQAEQDAGVKPEYGRDSRRPSPYTPTAPERAQLEGKSPQEQLTLFRQFRDAAQER